MTKLEIISALWGVVYNLTALYLKTPTKSFEDIERDKDYLEKECRKYTDVDDDEVYTIIIKRG
ncbi:MAG: hypothetical protein LUG23_00115 [Oscillospiraceae bacterium]|nr:hypothetical protein [Oscillospiraceae bacterium]